MNYLSETENYIKTGTLTKSAYDELYNHVYSYVLNGYRVPANFNLSKDELTHEMVAHLISILPKYDSEKATLKHYIKYVSKTYLYREYNKVNRQKRQATIIDHIQGETGEIDLYDSYSFQVAMEKTIMCASENKEFVRDCLFWWCLNIDNYFRPNTKYHKAANRIIQILINKETFDGKFGKFVKLKLGVSRQSFHLIIEKMRKVNKGLYVKYLTEGTI